MNLCHWFDIQTVRQVQRPAIANIFYRLYVHFFTINQDDRCSRKKDTIVNRYKGKQFLRYNIVIPMQVKGEIEKMSMKI